MEESFGEIDRGIVRDLYKYAQTWGELSQVLTQQVEALGQLVKAGESGIWFTAGRDTAIVAGAVALGQSKSNRFEEVEVLTQSLRLIGERIDVELVKETSALIDRVIIITTHCYTLS